MKISVKKYMRDFEYDDQRICHLLGMFDDFVRFIQDYDGQFDMENKEHETSMLAGYRNNAFGILFSLLQLGHITTSDFHHRLHALNTVYFNRVGC